MLFPAPPANPTKATLNLYITAVNSLGPEPDNPHWGSGTQSLQVWQGSQLSGVLGGGDAVQQFKTVPTGVLVATLPPSTPADGFVKISLVPPFSYTYLSGLPYSIPDGNYLVIGFVTDIDANMTSSGDRSIIPSGQVVWAVFGGPGSPNFQFNQSSFIEWGTRDFANAAVTLDGRDKVTGPDGSQILL